MYTFICKCQGNSSAILALWLKKYSSLGTSENLDASTLKKNRLLTCIRVNSHRIISTSYYSKLVMTSMKSLLLLPWKRVSWTYINGCYLIDLSLIWTKLSSCLLVPSDSWKRLTSQLCDLAIRR